MAARPNRSATTVTAPAVDCYVKTIQVARTDTTAFNAFVLPKGAVPCGVYVIGQTASDAGTSAVIHVGSNPGTTNEILASYDVKAATGAGYNPGGAFGGTGLGVQLTADKLIKAVYVEAGTASTTGGTWLVKVEYYFPQSGETY